MECEQMTEGGKGHNSTFPQTEIALISRGRPDPWSLHSLHPETSKPEPHISFQSLSVLEKFWLDKYKVKGW